MRNRKMERKENRTKVKRVDGHIRDEAQVYVSFLDK